MNLDQLLNIGAECINCTKAFRKGLCWDAHAISQSAMLS